MRLRRLAVAVLAVGFGFTLATGAAGSPIPFLTSDNERDLSPEETERLARRGLRLAQFTVAYNVVEGAVAITAGLLAGLVSLVGFGVDSAIESASAVLVGLRLAARLRHGEADEVKERRALKAVAVTFFVGFAGTNCVDITAFDQRLLHRRGVRRRRTSASSVRRSEGRERTRSRNAGSARFGANASTAS